MANEREQVSQDVQNQIKGIGNSAKSLGKKGIKKLGNSKAGKAVKESLKKLSKALVKGFATAVKSIIAFLLPILLPLLAVLLPIIMIYVVINQIFYTSKAQSGAFQKDSREAFAKVLYNEDGSVASVNPTFENDLATLFYAKYAKYSFYYSVDNETKLRQASPNMKIRDIENRENLFVLNPQMLTILDQALNDPYKHPEQFVKPIYNTCLNKTSDDGYEEVDLSKCELKPLTNDDGDLVVESVQYGSVTDYEDYDYRTIYYKGKDKIVGLWDWGLAPIIHYASHDDVSYAKDLHLSTVEVVRNGEIIEVNFVDLSDDEKKKFKYDEIESDATNQTSVSRGSKYDPNNRIPATEKTYSIDNVVTFAGTIHNPTKEKEQLTGTLRTTLSNEYTEEAIADSEIIQNTLITKYVYNKQNALIGKYRDIHPVTIVDKDEYKDIREKELSECRAFGNEDLAGLGMCINKVLQKYPYPKAEAGISMDGKFFENSSMSDFAFTYDKTYNLKYTVGGDIYTNKLTYVNNTIDVSDLADIKYLQDYIDNYATFVEVGDPDKDEYVCHNIKTGNIANTISGGYLNSLVNFKSSNITAEGYLNETNTGNLSDGETVDNPNECKNNQIALRKDGGEMTSFWLKEMPDIQRLGSAEVMGYNLLLDAEGGVYAQGGSELREDLVIDIDDNTEEVNEFLSLKDEHSGITVDEVIKKTAAKYKIDANVLAAIAYARSDGDIAPRNTDENCIVDREGCGAFGVKEKNGAIHYYDFETNQNVNKTQKDYNFEKLEDSIDALGALYQNYANKYNGNPFIAIQAIEFGSKVMDATLQIAADELLYTGGYPTDEYRNIEWMYYRKYAKNNVEGADEVFATKANFLEDVLSGLSEKYKIQVWANNSWKSQSWSFMQTKVQKMSSAADQFTEMANRRLEKNEASITNGWDTMYLGQKSYHDGIYNDLYSANPYDMPEKARFFTSDVNTERLRDRLIHLIFAYADGGEIQEYDNMTEYDLKARIVDMFQIGDFVDISTNYDISKIVPSGVVKKIAKQFYITRGYGSVYDYETEKRSFHNDVEVEVGKQAEIYSIMDGVVDSVQVDMNDVYEISISQTDSIYSEKEGVSSVKTFTLYYSNLGDCKVKRGDEVHAGDLIGHSRTDEDVIYVETYLDRDRINAQTVIEYLLMKFDMSAFRKLKGYKLSSSDLQPPVKKKFSLSATCPWYPGDFTTIHGSFHGGVDIVFYNEPTLGQEIIAPADAVILWSHDGCPTEGSLSSKCGAPVGGNSAVLLSEVEDTTYVMYFAHMQNGTVAVKAGDIVQQGDLIGKAGSSGMSTGPHLHYEIWGMGDMSIDEVIQYYDKTGSIWFTNGKAYDDPDNFCETKLDKFCRANPAILYGWEIGEYYDGQ